jgi:hypothetical protein
MTGYHVFFEDETRMLKEVYQKILDDLGTYVYKDKKPEKIHSELISDEALYSYADEFVTVYKDKSIWIYCSAKYELGTYLEGLYKRKIPRIYVFIEYKEELFIFKLVFWDVKFLNPDGYSVQDLVTEAIKSDSFQFHKVDEHTLNALKKADLGNFLFILKIVLSDEIEIRKKLRTKYTNGYSEET